MDYLSFYGLKEEPFRLTPDPEYFLASRSHNSALLSLNYSANHREGFTLVTGEPGTGKTTLLNVFIEQWRQRAEIAMILTPRLSPEEFLLAVLEDFGINSPFAGKNEIIRRFRDFLVEKSLSRRGIIIVVDEAQNLPTETLEELRLLSNLETDKEKLLHIILIGQPELLRRLYSHELRQFDQRIITRINIQPLGLKDVGDYINFRLSKAGRGCIRFGSGALKEIHRHSRGIPRIINTITTRSMMSAFLEEAEEVGVRHVAYALKSLRNETGAGTKSSTGRRALYWAAAAAAAICTIPLAMWGQGRLSPPGNPLPPLFGTESSAAMNIPSMPAEENEKPQASTSKVSDANRQVTIDAAVAPSTPDTALAQSQTQPAVSATVISGAVTLREKPDLKGKRRYILYRGDELKVHPDEASSGGHRWLHVEVREGISGWVAAEAVKVGK